MSSQLSEHEALLALNELRSLREKGIDPFRVEVDRDEVQT